MSTAKPHGMPESGAPEKYPKPAKGGTRGPWPKGGNFLGSGEVPPPIPTTKQQGVRINR